MPRGEDKNSWAHEMGQRHDEKVRRENQRARTAVQLVDYMLTTGIEFTGFESLDQFTQLQKLIEQYTGTGTQSASEGSAKPLLVGSTPTPCSKVHETTIEICPRCGYTPGPYYI